MAALINLEWICMYHFNQEIIPKLKTILYYCLQNCTLVSYLQHGWTFVCIQTLPPPNLKVFFCHSIAWKRTIYFFWINMVFSKHLLDSHFSCSSPYAYWFCERWQMIVKSCILVHIANYSFDRLGSGQVCKIYFYW